MAAQEKTTDRTDACTNYKMLELKDLVSAVSNEDRKHYQDRQREIKAARSECAESSGIHLPNVELIKPGLNHDPENEQKPYVPPIKHGPDKSDVPPQTPKVNNDGHSGTPTYDRLDSKIKFWL